MLGTRDFELSAVGFDDIPGWSQDDHQAALAALAKAAAVIERHPPKVRQNAIDIKALTEIVRDADIALRGDLTAAAATQFFETRFAPYRVGRRGFYTGYYEPIVMGSRHRTDTHRYPLLGRPEDLVDVSPGVAVTGMPDNTRFARWSDGMLAAYPDREAISAGYLEGRGLELTWLNDPVDVFYIHIQGSARVRFQDGGEMRLTYAAKNGHPYTAIGRVLIERGDLPKGGADMAAIRGWFTKHPEKTNAVLNRNRSYIFFKEAPVVDKDLGPVAAARVPLTPGRSLAVDRSIHSFHLPVFVDTTLADGTPYRRLMIAQDTGSAIIGPARGDIFLGSGEDAGDQAGKLQSEGDFIVLLPRDGAP